MLTAEHKSFFLDLQCGVSGTRHKGQVCRSLYRQLVLWELRETLISRGAWAQVSLVYLDARASRVRNVFSLERRNCYCSYCSAFLY